MALLLLLAACRVLGATMFCLLVCLLLAGRPRRTYRYDQGTPLFSFGQGLSYTTFSVDCFHATSDTGVVISCTVTNSGSRDGDDVLLVFHRCIAIALVSVAMAKW
jgi:hypothetical protein